MNDGGPARPTRKQIGVQSSGLSFEPICGTVPGFSKLEEYAKAAMEGHLSNPNIRALSGEELARASFMLAKDMLAEHERLMAEDAKEGE